MCRNKTPIIFIHGILSSPYCWNKVKSKICDKTGRKGYAVCLRNHGSSEWSEEMSAFDMAEDVKEFMKKEHVSKAILIAHGIAGFAALVIAFTNKPNEKALSRPMIPLLPFYKNKSGKFVWEINVDVVIKMSANIQSFQIPLKEDTIYPGETLFIAAEFSSFVVLKQKEVILKHIPKIRFVLAEGVYHSCHLEKPEKYVDIITKFLVP
ncbi:Protein ABHD11 like protein [Argiope bruennichi]|uniref:Protein ABHD11 like protein n=1 Tax=Argiope bruennichi TaxID=94029 RepID=A0A8T0E1T2_ARGBR|nr:Protein ABHD11 like protein [Argiope bruennichi]